MRGDRDDLTDTRRDLQRQPGSVPMSVRMRSQTLSVPEAAVALGISRNSAYEAIRRGEIPAIRLGRRLVVPRPALASMLSASGDPTASSEPGVHARR